MPESEDYNNNSEEIFKYWKINTWLKDNKWKKHIMIISSNLMIWLKLLNNKIKEDSKKIKLKNKALDKKSKIKTFKNKIISSLISNPNKLSIIPNSNKCIRNILLILEKELNNIPKPLKIIKIWLKKLINLLEKSAPKNLKLTYWNLKFFNIKSNAKQETMLSKNKNKTSSETIKSSNKRWIDSETKKKEDWKNLQTILETLFKD